MIAEPPLNQSQRLQELYRYRILDTPTEQLYDDVAFLAAQICDSPIAVINFVDEHRQWFKAEVGLGVRQTPLDTSICSHAILEKEFLLVPDTLLDRRFMDNPLCSFDPHLRFYAGALLKTGNGLPLGTVCVLDTKPRELTDHQKSALLRLARQVMSLLELRVALEQTRISEELARNAMESSTDCIAVLDLDGQVLSINAQGSRLFSGHRWPDTWSGSENRQIIAALESARDGKAVKLHGLRRAAMEADTFWDVTVSPISDTQAKPSRILSVARDVTVRRVEEAQLRETAKLESLGVLAGGIAHDFNNLLTGVLGNASLLEMSANLEDAALASQIVEAAQRCADLTRQMLAYSGKGRFLVKRLNLSMIVKDNLRLVRATLDKKVEFTLSLDENLPSVEADPGQMQQLVMNLIINASEAMEGRAGKVIISTTAINVDAAFLAQTFRSDELSLRAGRYVRLDVQDSGFGMNDETMAKIFDPFFTTKFTGRGLGLAAVSGILRGHQGAIRVRSHPGQGSTFTVFLPVAAALPQDSSIETLSDVPPYRGYGTILLVDDEDTVRSVGQNALERAGFDVLLAENGKLAVESLKAHRETIRLIILDLTMPVMGGEEALSLLREVDPRIPIILSSGYNQVDLLRPFTDDNRNSFIQKPYTSAELTAAIARALPY